MHQPIVRDITAAAQRDASAQRRRETSRKRVPKGAPIVKNEEHSKVVKLRRQITSLGQENNIRKFI